MTKWRGDSCHPGFVDFDGCQPRQTVTATAWVTSCTWGLLYTQYTYSSWSVDLGLNSIQNGGSSFPPLNSRLGGLWSVDLFIRIWWWCWPRPVGLVLPQSASFPVFSRFRFRSRLLPRPVGLTASTHVCVQSFPHTYTPRDGWWLDLTVVKSG